MQYRHKNIASNFLINLVHILSLALVTLPLLLFTHCSSRDQKKTIGKTPGDLELAESCKLRDSYDSAIAYYHHFSDQCYKTKSWDNWGKGINGMIDCYRSKGDLSSAINLLNKSDSLARNSISVRSELFASLIHKKAILFSEKGEYERSNEYFLQTISLRDNLKLSRDTTLALSYNGLGTNFLYLGKYDEAYDYYEKAINNYEKLGLTKTADYAMFNLNAGIIHAIRGDYPKAQLHFDLSLSINKAILDKNDPKLALVYLNLGRFFSMTGNDEKALELLTQSEDIFKLKDRKSSKLASLYLNIGSIYVNKANYEKALSYYNKALALMQANTNGNPSDLLTVLLNLGFIYEKKGDFAAANKYYQEGLQKGDKFPNSVKVLRGLANINTILGKKTEATAYYDLSVKQSIELCGPNHPETGLTYLKYGEFCSINNEKQRAIDFLHKGIDIYKLAYGEKSRDLGYAYLQLANYFSRIHEYSKALPEYQKALIATFQNFNDVNILKNPKPDMGDLSYYQLNILTEKAFAFYSLYQHDPSKKEFLQASADTYTEAITFMELLRSTYQEEDSKLMIAGSEKNTVLNAIRTQVDLYRNAQQNDAFEKAFMYAEKGKSSVLMSYLRDMEAKDLGKIPDKLQKLDNQLKTEISFYNKLIFDETSRKDANQSKINLWNNTVFELSRKHDSLISVIEKSYPAYYNLKYDNSVITLKSLKERIAPNQAILEYTLADTTLYLFLIVKNDAKLFVTPVDTGFLTNIATLREMLTGKSFNNYSPEDFHSFTDASYSLYKVLLEPVQSLIQNKELIIIPDAELGYLSFDILLTHKPGPKAKGYRGLPYLIKEAPISYAPSATALFEGFKNPIAPKNHKVLAFAPSYENVRNVKIKELLRGKTSYPDYLMPIPGAQIEVKNLKKIFSSKVFDGSDATESNFKKYAGNYSILHLAMHTIINNNNPLYSKLVFYRNGDTLEDGLLNTSELFSMQLNADLAVLSACNTGTGKLERGEGIMSLARGFFYAGVPSIIMTSWAVEDNSGVDLMTSFYKYLAEGKAKNEALRLAKLDYLENSDQLKSHPHFWAAYMNIGDISPIQNLKSPTPVYLIFIFSIAGFLVLAGGFLYFWKKEHRFGK
ncbi:MAG: CHAT domain-containing protein [Bacteroidetes bacterium]|nr:CHAT domain-containing protein [Bacteroidota bacterium]